MSALPQPRPHLMWRKSFFKSPVLVFPRTAIQQKDFNSFLSPVGNVKLPAIEPKAVSNTTRPRASSTGSATFHVDLCSAYFLIRKNLVSQEIPVKEYVLVKVVIRLLSTLSSVPILWSRVDRKLCIIENLLFIYPKFGSLIRIQRCSLIGNDPLGQ